MLEAVTFGHLADGSSSPPEGGQAKRDKNTSMEQTWSLGDNQSSKDLINKLRFIVSINAPFFYTTTHKLVRPPSRLVSQGRSGWNVQGLWGV